MKLFKMAAVGVTLAMAASLGLIAGCGADQQAAEDAEQQTIEADVEQGGTAMDETKLADEVRSEQEAQELEEGMIAAEASINGNAQEVIESSIE